MKKRKKFFTSMILTILAIVIFIPTTQAYNFTGNRWPKKSGQSYTVYLRYGMPNTSSYTIYRDAFASAVSDWNSSQSKISFNLSDSNASSPFYVGTYYTEFQEIYGECKCYGSFSSDYIFETVNVLLNTNNPGIQTKSKTRRSVAGHELGHALGLHEENSVANALMNQNRNRETIYTPQTDDINGVNARYPN